ncbi:TetR/AcrR family transcriptional regulator [Pseudochrobactrum kiredjianiae]|uniref:TetR/AcrR family transcriptional regulator n=1 Tax=Pseudochrobactrum kiredjianiae TaxID=386305 RepID=A0ABW3V4B2_9HYPH|nr:TetR/AcrR family transcriptional regulator [Pseudochrobactrum kiredjianiae]MDM7852991.1 TetR/AcrR family transcriptional regulator [Pseudochrobactrum kiredjianiae]
MCNRSSRMPSGAGRDLTEGLATNYDCSRYERQKQRILDAAVILLNEKGIQGMTLADVGKALDLKTTAVTYYFRRKEHLIIAIYEDTLERLTLMARSAGQENTPRKRVTRYLDLYSCAFADTLQNEGRPVANLSELRSIDATARARLFEQYRIFFREVRSFFGPAADEDHRRLFTVRAHILIEAVFWQNVWLGQFAIGDFPNVRQRFLDILDGGLAWEFHTSNNALFLEPDAIASSVEQESFLCAATKLINDIGYRGASVTRIMAELKRTKGSFYHHLDSKDDLINACWQISHSRLTSLYTKVSGTHNSPWKQLSSLLSSVLAIQFNEVFPFLRVTACQSMPPAIRDAALQKTHQITLSIMGILVTGIQEGSIRRIDPLIASHLIISALNAASELQQWREGQSIEEMIKIYTTTLSNGIFDQE